MKRRLTLFVFKREHFYRANNSPACRGLEVIAVEGPVNLMCAMRLISSFIDFNLFTHCFLAYLLSMKGNFDVVTRGSSSFSHVSVQPVRPLCVVLPPHDDLVNFGRALRVCSLLHVDPSNPPHVLSCINRPPSLVPLLLTCRTLCFSLSLSPQAGDHQSHRAADRGHQQRRL